VGNTVNIMEGMARIVGAAGMGIPVLTESGTITVAAVADAIKRTVE
jgi:hypothetical protein